MSWIKNKQRKNLTEDLNSSEILQHFHHHGGDGSMFSMTGLREIVSVFVGWSGLLLFPTAYLAIGGYPLGLLSSRVGILTGWQVPIWRVQTFLLRQFLLQQMLWVILFCFSGVLKSQGFRQVVPTWGTLEFCGAPRSLRSYRFYAQAV